jgi:hypothetical protein
VTPGTDAASLYRLELQLPAPAGNADWRTNYAGNGSSDRTWIGEGVHPDVHRLRWLPALADGRECQRHGPVLAMRRRKCGGCRG